ncbi:MAG: hypothetical protein Ct9H300mP1_30240 [Planctomycetaceae bacterium]|nr:MAG: hypothetical protein Ct9H300mP1_30240 [Planctomycetaceae bacterium]
MTSVQLCLKVDSHKCRRQRFRQQLSLGNRDRESMCVGGPGFISGFECEGGSWACRRWCSVNPSVRRVQCQPTRQLTINDLPRHVAVRRIRSKPGGIRDVDAGIGQRLPNDRQ